MRAHERAVVRGVRVEGDGAAVGGHATRAEDAGGGGEGERATSVAVDGVQDATRRGVDDDDDVVDGDEIEFFG